MSSLLQFEGLVDRRKGVQLIAMLTKKEWVQVGDGEVGYHKHVNVETIGDTGLSALYTFWRMPRGALGAWAIFEYNGDKQIPDLSIPISLEKLPHDAKRIPDQAAIRYWVDDGTRIAPVYEVCYHRDDERLEKLKKLGVDTGEDLIPETELPRLYTFERARARDWHIELELSDTITSFEILPPGATRIPDQAALRCWYEV